MSHAYRHRARPFLLLAVLCLSAGLTGLIDPATRELSATGRALSGPIDELWLVAYVVAGVGIAAGYIFERPAMEAVGLWFAGAAAVVNLVVIIDLRGVAGLPSFPAYAVTLYVVGARLRELHTSATRPEGIGAPRRR